MFQESLKGRVGMEAFNNYVTLGRGGVRWSVIVFDRVWGHVRTLQLDCLTIVVSSDTQSVQCLWTSTCLIRSQLERFVLNLSELTYCLVAEQTYAM